MKKLLFLILSVAIYSCDQLIDRIVLGNNAENYVSSFSGTYKGSYSGDNNGALIIEVAKNGYTSLTRTSQFGTENSFISGMIRDDGALYSVSMDSGFTLYGNLHNSSGTWKMGDRKGSWSVTKQ